MYYKLDVNSFEEPGPYSTRFTGWSKELDYGPWIRGCTIEQKFDKPLEFELWEYDEGYHGVAEIFLDTIPLMREDVIETLRSVHVDNMQLIPAVLKDLKRDIILENYYAVNVIGMLKVVDMDRSEYTDLGGIGVIAVSFRKMVIDEQEAAGMLMFRPAESITDIIVHESVREEIMRRNFKYILFRDMEGKPLLDLDWEQL